MEAPDKIYIAETPNKLIEIWSDEPIEPKPYITEHEYIRKDAILEWAKECTDSFNEQMRDLKQTDIAYRVICGGLSTIELLLNKLNEL